MVDSIKTVPILAKLKPFDEFQRKITPLFARVALEECKPLVEKIYALAAQKMHQEAIKGCIVESVGALRKERVQLTRKRAHIRNAIRELLAADTFTGHSLQRNLQRAWPVQIPD